MKPTLRHFAEALGQLAFVDATLTNPTGSALNLEHVHAGTLFLKPKMPLEGTVHLTDAHVDDYVDSQATWPPDIRLDGFTYGKLVATPEVNTTARLRWLKRDPHRYTPQLYEQLAATYRKAGRDEAARRVAIAKQWRRRRELNPLGKLWNWLLYVTVGYGYRTWLAVPWLTVLLAAGTRVFDHAYPKHMVAARQPAPEFHPLAYTLDRLLPRAPPKCGDGRCGWSDRLDVKQARESETMRFSSPHDLTDTRACRPIIPHPRCRCRP
jgi:hypothetical protein